MGSRGVAESVDTAAVVAGLGGGRTGGSAGATHRDAGRLQNALAISRRAPKASIQRSDYPRRPKARTCYCVRSLKALLMR